MIHGRENGLRHRGSRGLAKRPVLGHACERRKKEKVEADRSRRTTFSITHRQLSGDKTFLEHRCNTEHDGDPRRLRREKVNSRTGCRPVDSWHDGQTYTSRVAHLLDLQLLQEY
jgi:hypothetical protein